MIFYLLLSILSSTALLIILRSFTIWKVDTLHGIIFNYYTAALFSYIMNDKKEKLNLQELYPVWWICVIIGALFIVVFFITAKTSQISGVAVASVASKMSMVIPITAGIFLYHESLGTQKIIGMLIAIPAVIFASMKGKDEATVKTNYLSVALPVMLFLGAGLVDTTIKFAQNYFITENNENIVLMLIFLFAGLIGTCRLIYEVVFLKKLLSLRSVGGGIVLGIVNYFSLFYLLKCLASPGTESSNVFALVNTGVVITSFIAGLLLFREKANTNKVIGIIMALVAIAIISNS